MDQARLIADLRAERDELAAKVRYYEDLLKGGCLPTAIAFQITPSQRRMLALLVESPSGCDQWQFHQALYFDRPGDPPDIGVISTQLSFMEARLRPLGIVVERSGGQPKVYRLAAAGREIIARLMSEEVNAGADRIKAGLREFAPKPMFGGAHAR